MVLNTNKCENIKIYCRLKPISSKLIPIKYTLSKNFEDGSLTINLENKNIKPENSIYKFHDVFPSTSSQSMVFEKIASPMVDRFVQKGENCTIFSYGQTGSGKTYTICGLKLAKDRGLIHKTFDRLFDLTQSSSSGAEYEINVSFVEIYNNVVQDLATPREHRNKMEPYRTLVTNKSDAIKLFEESKLKRKTSATNRNKHSSRSHFICTIYLRKKNYQGFDAQFKLVDLAGSEDYNSVYSDTKNRIEALAVKKSLYSLKNISRILANPGFKGIIPYRDSKLTYELRSTLERKCHVAMIANVDSNAQCIKELINTFEYAREVASIKKLSSYTLECAPLIEMSDKLVLMNENKNLRTEIASIKTKYENMKTLLKKQNDLLSRKDREDINKNIAGSDVPLKTRESTQTRESNNVQLNLKFMNNCLDDALFGDKTSDKCVRLQPSYTVTAFEDDEPHAPPSDTHEWRPYDSGCYHKALCILLSGACGFCELGLKPAQEPASAATGRTEASSREPPRLFHYLPCPQKIDGRPCIDHHRGKVGTCFSMTEVAKPVKTVRNVQPAAAVSPRRPSGARQWLPYGRDSYHEIRCSLPWSDNRAAAAAVCFECKSGHVREPVNRDGAGDDGRPLYVHYVWCLKMMNGRPCYNEGHPRSLARISVAEPNAATMRPADSEAVRQRPRAENSVPLVKNTGPRVKNDGPQAINDGQRANSKHRATITEPPQRHVISVAPAQKIAKKILLTVDEINSVEYYEKLLNSMKVPNKYTLHKY